MVIVNFSTHQYLSGQRRLANSIKGYETLMFDDYKQIGSPTHQESPYEFKLKAIRKALEHDPICLWMDASMWAVKSLSGIESIIINDGYILTEAGHYVYKWCNDHCRKTMDFKPSEHHFLMFSAGLVGINRNSEIAMDFLQQWEESAKNGCFVGSHSDHRHDQTAGSIIAQRMKLKYQRGGQFLSYIGPGYSPPEPDSPIYLQGL